MSRVPVSRQSWVLGLILLLPGIVAVLATTYSWASPLTLLHDPFRISEFQSPLHPLMGALSSFGAIMLYCTSAIALFSAAITSDHTCRKFLIYAGLLSSCLGTDDLFGFHDRVFREIFVREAFVKAFFMVAQIVYIVAFWRVLKKLNYTILVGALSLFATSMFLDSHFLHSLKFYSALSLSPGMADAWEDLPKLAGTVLWLWFHMLAARQIITEGQSKGSAAQPAREPAE